MKSLLLLFTPIALAQTPTSDMQRYQDLQVAEFMNSNRLINIAIVIFIALVIIVVVAVFIH